MDWQPAADRGSGVNLSGRLAEVWDEDGQAGVLLDWTLAGHASDWQGTARGYRLVRVPAGCRVRFPLMHRGTQMLVLVGTGEIRGELVPDNIKRHEELTLSGKDLEVARDDDTHRDGRRELDRSP